MAHLDDCRNTTLVFLVRPHLLVHHQISILATILLVTPALWKNRKEIGQSSHALAFLKSGYTVAEESIEIQVVATILKDRFAEIRNPEHDFLIDYLESSSTP